MKMRWSYAVNVTMPSEFIVAPALVHNVSFAGDSARRDIPRTDFGLYGVYRPKGERWWITTDLMVSYDFESQKTIKSVEVSFGRNLAMLRGGAALNGYIRPGVSIGRDRPYDWNIEVVISVVGF